MYSFDPTRDGRWRRFIDRREDSSVFHSIGWLEALRRTYGYEPIVYTSSPPEAELEDGLLFCRINTWLSRPRLVSVPFSDHAALLMDQEVLRSVLAHVLDGPENGSCRYLEVRPTAQLAKYTARLGQSTVFYWHRLDLSRPLEVIHHSFHADCVRRKIRRSERDGVAYSEGRSAELVEQFYHQLLLAHRRHGIPPQPMAWFRTLCECLGESVKIRIASFKGVPIAGIMTLTYKKAMVFKYGGSDARHHRLGGMALLLWRAIQDAKDRGLQELDLGRSDRDNSGLIHYKEHWGAHRSELVYWGYPSGRQLDLNRNGKVLRTVTKHLPNAALSLLGRLLYRHTG